MTRYLGHGWFAIARHNPAVLLVARHAGDAKWLSPTVLRVQAFLELPFTVFAYLAVARLLGTGVVRQLTRAPVIVAACVSFTITFSLVEIRLANPWTTDDLVLRALACVVTPAWVIATTRS